MSPRSDSGRSATTQQRSQPSRSTSQPYPPSSSSRRPSSHAQPKSTRQQFSACGACRMRRVKCDLKDLQASSTTTGHVACSNCQERNLKCVDEFAEVKAVKLLRRGRRLQQVEAVYGKAGVGAESDRHFSQMGPPQCTIPMLQPEFFSSAFYYRFLVQRPIIDAHDFAARFNNGDIERLGEVGRLICLVLSTWAASFGVNEKGEPERHTGYETIKQRRDRTNTWVLELLRAVDHYGLLRKPTWDGVQVLLLLLPLTEDVQTSLERLAVYEAVINQVYMLCTLTTASTVRPAVRARIFWYAHVHEGLTTGIRGGRLLLTMEDLDTFQASLPHFPEHQHATQEAFSLSVAMRFSKTPLRVSEASRLVHGCLTGLRARQRTEINETQLRRAWELLDISWRELQSLQFDNNAGFLQPDDVEVFANGWQILIFECHNVIRDSLRQRANDAEKFGVQPSQVRHVRELYAEADRKCREIATLVFELIRQHLDGPLFEFDASLVRDGCFFAANLLANDGNRDGDAELCIRALRKMRWAFCKSEERENTVRLALQSRPTSDGVRRMSLPALHTNNLAHLDHSAPPSAANSPCSSGTGASRTPPQHNMLRTIPPPLILATNGNVVESGPNTAVTDDGSWPSISHCSSTSASTSGSPPFISGKADPVGAAVLYSESSIPMTNIDSAHASLYMSDLEYTYPPVSSASGPERHSRSTPLRTPTSMNPFNDNYFDTAAGVFASSSLETGSSQGAEVGPSYHPRFSSTPGHFFVSP